MLYDQGQKNRALTINIIEKIIFELNRWLDILLDKNIEKKVI